MAPTFQMFLIKDRNCRISTTTQQRRLYIWGLINPRECVLKTKSKSTCQDHLSNTLNPFISFVDYYFFIQRSDVKVLLKFAPTFQRCSKVNEKGKYIVPMVIQQTISVSDLIFRRQK